MLIVILHRQCSHIYRYTHTELEAHTHTHVQTDRQTWHQCTITHTHTHALTHSTRLWNWEILFGLQQAFNRIRNRHPKLMGFCLSCCCYYWCCCCCCHAVERDNSFVNKIQCTNRICWASHAHARTHMNQWRERQKQNTRNHIEKWIFSMMTQAIYFNGFYRFVIIQVYNIHHI